MSNTEKAISYLGRAARIRLTHLHDNPGAYTKKGSKSSGATNRHGQSMKELQTAAKPPLGWIWGDFFNPWQRKFPSDITLNGNAHLRRDYPPLSLIELQRLIDLGWLNTSRPIDLTQLCRTHQYSVDVDIRQFGVQLTSEGADDFVTPIDIEVQYADEISIAAIEKCGGRVTLAYYDPRALEAVVAPSKLFEKSRPIPPRLPPPNDLIDMYSDPDQRGYLCSESDLQLARFTLSQRYGYVLPATPQFVARKSPSQCFHGLRAGWVVNTADKTVVKAEDVEIEEYYGEREKAVEA